MSIHPPLPSSSRDLDVTGWETIAPFFTALQERPLTQETLPAWLADWSDLSRLVSEAIAEVYLAKAQDTTNKQREAAFLAMVENVMPALEQAEQNLRQRLLQFDLDDPDLAQMHRRMRNQAALFRQANLPLLTELQKLGNTYDNITGSLTVSWEGEQRNFDQLTPALTNPADEIRAAAWRKMSAAWLAVRGPLGDNYLAMLPLRQQVARNAGFNDYRAYAFRAKERFDYTPDDCLLFHRAIEEAVLPVVAEILARKKQALGRDTLYPWDWIPDRNLAVSSTSGPVLRPYEDEEAFIRGTIRLFGNLDPVLGRQFARLAEEQTLDLQTRPGKAMGGFCMPLASRRLPFIFMNGNGTHNALQTLLHEAGHAFHFLAASDLPYIWQTNAPMEFCEVASMAMEFLAGPHLQAAAGGFYTPAEAARARLGFLEGQVLFLPYMAVVDAFQHWVYIHVDEIKSQAQLDEVWDSLWQRFLPGVEWHGHEEARATGWQRKLHITQSPFYYVEYGLALLGALQVWRNSLTDQAAALAAYRQALALGDTQPLPALFNAAGAAFRFDTPLLRSLMTLVSETMATLTAEIASSD